MTGHKEEIGNALRNARQAAGLTLKDIADAIRVRPIYLQAIEAGQFELLPALPQTVGFTRAYARYLEVDVERPLSRLGEEVHETIERTDYSEPEIPWTMVSSKRLAWVGGGVALGLVIAASLVIDLDPPRGAIAVASFEAERDAATASFNPPVKTSPEDRAVSASGNTLLPAAQASVSRPALASMVSRTPASEPSASMQQVSFKPAPVSSNASVSSPVESASAATPRATAEAESVSAQSSVSGASSEASVEAAPVEPASPAASQMAAAEPAAIPAEEGDKISPAADAHFATGSVYIRSMPDNSGKVVGVLNSCEPVELLGNDRTDYWREVKRDDGTSGWVFRDFVSGEAPAACS